MSRVCEHHQENPVRVYNQCVGCELKSLHTDIERLTKERDALQTAVKEYEFWIKNIGNPAKEANTAMREALEWYYAHGGKRAQAVLEKIGEKEPATTVTLRWEVRWFAEQMEIVLGQNEHKGGWKNCDLRYLYSRLREEAQELWSEFNQAEPNWRGIRWEAVDIANFAMMIADHARINIGR